MRLPRVVFLHSFASLVSAAVHNLFVPDLRGSGAIHALEFDDVNNTLVKVKSFQADSSHSWIQFDHAKKNVYSSSLDVARIASYKVTSATSIELVKSIKIDSACPSISSQFGMTTNFALPMDIAPYPVLAASSACGVSLAVDGNGTLDKVVNYWPYTSGSLVHGLAVVKAEDKILMYSADANGDMVWTHAVNATSGKATEVGRLKTTPQGAHPRHVAAHPNGKVIYVLTEAGNTLSAFPLDLVSGAAQTPTSTYSLIPDGANKSNYWSANVMLSVSNKYLWASTRLRVSSTGAGSSYISCFLLSDSGVVVKRMFTIPTSKDTGAALAVNPAFWSDEYAAVSYYPDGDVEILKLDGRNETADGVEYATATALVKIAVGSAGCCANTIWSFDASLAAPPIRTLKASCFSKRGPGEPIRLFLFRDNAAIGRGTVPLRAVAHAAYDEALWFLNVVGSYSFVVLIAMDGFSVASQAASCLTVSHRALSAAVQLDEIAQGQGSTDNPRAQSQSLSGKLRELSITAEKTSDCLTRTSAISVALQRALTQFTVNCDRTAAIVEKDIKASHTGSAKHSLNLDLDRLSAFEHWATLTAHSLGVLQGLIQTGTVQEQDELVSSPCSQQVFEECNAACLAVAKSSGHLVEMHDHDGPPGYVADGASPLGDVKDKTLSYPDSATTTPTPSTSSLATSPRSSKSSRSGMGSLSDAFKAMTAPFRYKPEPLVVALCESSARGDVRTIASLVSSGANINGRDEKGMTPMTRAIENRQSEAITRLLDLGASTDVCDSAKKLPALFWAAATGDVALTKVFLARGCSPRAVSVYGTHYFIETVSQGNIPIINLLLDFGADITATDRYGQSIIYHAYSKGSLELLKLLHSRGANLNAKNLSGTPIVVLALQEVKMDIFRFLVEHGADVNSRSITGTPLIVEALQQNKQDVLRLLLDRGADPNSRDIMGMPMLFIVVKNSSLSPADKATLVRLLLQRGADPNFSGARDNWGKTGMSTLLESGDGADTVELVRLLVERGADPNQALHAADYRGAGAGQTTLLLHAISRGDNELAPLLLRHGANANATDKSGRTPLMQALLRGDSELARLLITHGADVNKVGSITPLELARALGDGGLSSLLVSLGAQGVEVTPAVSGAARRARATPAAGQAASSSSSATLQDAKEPPPEYDAVANQ